MRALSSFPLFSKPYRVAQCSTLVLFVLSLIAYDRPHLPFGMRVALLALALVCIPMIIGMSMYQYLRATARTPLSFSVGMISTSSWILTWVSVYSAFTVDLLHGPADGSWLVALAPLSLIIGIACWAIARWLQTGRWITPTEWFTLVLFLVASAGAVSSLLYVLWSPS